MSAINAALAKLQEKLPKVAKTKTANVRGEKANYSYKYADLADVSAAVMPLMGSLGLSFTSRPTLDADGRFVLVYELRHADGEIIPGQYPLPQSGSPQAMGSAITYGRRYSLCAVTGLVADEDDDGQAAEHGPAGGQVRRTRATKPPMEEDSSASQITDAQMKKLQAAFHDVGITERDLRLAFASDTIGRVVDSAKDLNKTEASKVIDALVKMASASVPEPNPDWQGDS